MAEGDRLSGRIQAEPIRRVMFALQYVMPKCQTDVSNTPAALLALTLITALASCETESPSPTMGPLRDTLPNGAVLVRYPDLPAIDSVGPEVAEAHVDLQFGSVDGTDPNLTFGAIRVQAASDGTIYVLDQQAAEVRVFDSDGRYLRTIVRQGEGPGEIGGANGIFLSGDTLLWINDTRQRTIIGVDTDGDEVRRFPKPVMSVAITWTGVFDDRRRYWREVSQSDNQPGFPPPVGLTSWTGRHYYKSHNLSSGAIDSVQLGETRFQIYSYSTPHVPFGFLPLRFEPFEMPGSIDAVSRRSAAGFGCPAACPIVTVPFRAIQSRPASAMNARVNMSSRNATG
ncbi:MAG: 6-bladed beta-propeller [Gemmatimonadetes bacterium]|nr:6-bladed beta-propeller [Gemmatimonadota bacterium]